MKDKEKSPRLGSYFEAPEFLRVPYILSGYRLNHTIVDCCRSLIHIHNETGKIIEIMIIRYMGPEDCARARDRLVVYLEVSTSPPLLLSALLPRLHRSLKIITISIH